MPPDLELVYMSGRRALAEFGKGNLSPVELLDATITRAEEVEPAVNAIAERFYEDARSAARKAETAYAGKTGKARPLEGLPLAVKESDRLAGTRRTEGSLLHTNRIDTDTSIVLTRLLAAGAIPHLKTTVPEFCILGATHSRLFGVTRNPWNLDFSPGGSSGGSAVALASGAATLATGTDIGGSIRIPASACGVVGYKAPYGRNPGEPVANLDTYNHIGVMARSVEDVALTQNVISGQHSLDIASLRDKVWVPTRAPANLTGRRIAWSADLGVYEIDTPVATATEAAIRALKDLGAIVEEVSLGWDRDTIRAAEAHLAHGWGNMMSKCLEVDRPYLTAYAIDYIENAAKATVADYRFAKEVEWRMYSKFGPMMEEFDAFVCPTLSVPSVAADFTPMKTPITVNGCEKLMSDDEWTMTTPFNMLSRCPVLAVPSGFASTGVPTGIQIVGRAYDDSSVFEVGLAYEREVGQITPTRGLNRHVLSVATGNYAHFLGSWIAP